HGRHPVEHRGRPHRAGAHTRPEDPVRVPRHTAGDARPARARRARHDRHRDDRHCLGGPRAGFEPPDAAHPRPQGRGELDSLDQGPLREAADEDLRMNAVFDWAAWFASLCFVIAMVCATARLFIGPNAQDRILALDTFYINGMLTLLMLGIRSDSTVYFDMALLIALFGFVSTIALAKFLLRGEVIEP